MNNLGLYLDEVTAAAGAVEMQPLGRTEITGASIASDCTYTLPDADTVGGVDGDQKRFEVVGTAVTTSDVVITVTSGLQMDGSTALASITLNAIGEYAVLEWQIDNWQLISYSGATLA